VEPDGGSSEGEGAIEFVLGRDYSVEDGLVVFTAFYLLEQGKCCWLGCRNCPWGFSGRPPAKRRRRGLPASDQG
jgi:hypothetical protein